MITHTMTINGAIRNPEGKLVAFYESKKKTLFIDGFMEEFQVTDEVHAMEIVGELVK